MSNVQIIYERAFSELEKDLASQREEVETNNHVRGDATLIAP